MYRPTLLGTLLVMILAACGTNNQPAELPTLVSFDEPAVAVTEEVAAASPTLRPSPTDPQVTLEAVSLGTAPPTGNELPEPVPEEEPPTANPNAAIPDAAPAMPDVSVETGYAFAVALPSTGGTINQEVFYVAQSVIDDIAATYGLGRINMELVGVQGTNRISFLLSWREGLPPGSYDVTFSDRLSTLDETVPVAIVRPDIVINASPLTPLQLDTASGTFTLEDADVTNINATIQFAAASDVGPVSASIRLKDIFAFELGDS